MRCLVVLAVSLLSFGYARVTFPHSEVLQAPDIAISNKANFNCRNKCKIYADRKSSMLTITQNGNIITNFDAIFEGNVFVPTGVELPAGDYVLENRGGPNPEFVFYIVDSQSRNYGSPVFAPQQTIGVSTNYTGRFVTILSSFEAMWFSAFQGEFPPSYPRIYATGFDAAADEACHPVYQARSQYSAEVSWPTIATAVLTVDFGYVGNDHNVSVNYAKANDPPKSAGQTTVYTSPGYVGCSFAVGQNYHSTLSEVHEEFTLTAEGLDVNAVYSGIAAGEPVHFAVSNMANDWKTLNFVGSDSYTQHYDKATFGVQLAWGRVTPGSNFAIQLDFRNDNAPIHVPTTTTTPTTSGPSTTSSEAGPSTTSVTGLSSFLTSLALVSAVFLRE